MDRTSFSRISLLFYRLDSKFYLFLRLFFLVLVVLLCLYAWGCGVMEGVKGVVLANSHPANGLRLNRCVNSLRHQMRLRGTNSFSEVFMFVTSIRTLASGTSGPRGVHRGVARMTLSCLSTNLSPRGYALCVRDVVPRLTRLAACLVGLVSMSHIRHGPAIGARVGVHGFRTGVPLNFFYCPIDRTTSVATFGTAAIPTNRSRRPVLRMAHRLIHHFGRACTPMLMRPRVLLPRVTYYHHLPKASNGRGVDGDLNGYVCVDSSRGAI